MLRPHFAPVMSLDLY